MSLSQWASDAFAGEKVIVTGASRGIGKDLAVNYHARGASVCMLARRGDAMEQTIREELGGGDGRAFSVPVDVTDEAALKAAVLASVLQLFCCCCFCFCFCFFASVCCSCG
eukprot:TRINITY_DN6012_c0_g1_i6.p1 TRINITY_DN6012_c0_g1~~TRINITY_DN6012_c0_g1_i6.p1  ORF type:complete len:124 (-),score=3.29 TRINITY_DN6012_c0_g1_i6:110-442(-)